MERRFLEVLILALIAGPMVALAVAQSARSSEPNFDRAPPLTITSRASDTMSASPGLRFSSFDADGCAFMSRAVIDDNGRVRTVNETFCKH